MRWRTVVPTIVSDVKVLPAFPPNDKDIAALHTIQWTVRNFRHAFSQRRPDGTSPSLSSPSITLPFDSGAGTYRFRLTCSVRHCSITGLRIFQLSLVPPDSTSATTKLHLHAKISSAGSDVGEDFCFLGDYHYETRNQTLIARLLSDGDFQMKMQLQLLAQSSGPAGLDHLLLQSGAADFLLLLDGKHRIAAHEDMLVKESEYFRTLFNDSSERFNERQHRSLQLKFVDVASLRRVLEFAYASACFSVMQLALEELVELLVCADRFQVARLQVLLVGRLRFCVGDDDDVKSKMSGDDAVAHFLQYYDACGAERKGDD